MFNKIIIVAGARPNFIKIAPLLQEFKRYKKKFKTTLVHTGQHYDYEMSEVFFRDLNIPKPDVYLGVRPEMSIGQTSKIAAAFEGVALKEKPDLIIVVGDVNSTLACSLVASKLHIRLAHIESGLRSFEKSMPEEINRIVTDSLSDYLFVSEKSGMINLKREGLNSRKVNFVGNIMIDTLLSDIQKIGASDILNKLRLTPKTYTVLTLHRPDNVDSGKSLFEIYGVLKHIAKKIKVIYPIHPRTEKMIKIHKFWDRFEKINNLLMIVPLAYTDFIKLIKEARFVLTDSGGIQEETTFLRVPCLTMRESTERPVTIEKGTAYLVGRNKKKILSYVNRILKGKTKKGSIPALWDGKTAKRIVEILAANR